MERWLIRATADASPCKLDAMLCSTIQVQRCASALHVVASTSVLGSGASISHLNSLGKNSLGGRHHSARVAFPLQILQLFPFPFHIAVSANMPGRLHSHRSSRLKRKRRACLAVRRMQRALGWSAVFVHMEGAIMQGPRWWQTPSSFLRREICRIISSQQPQGHRQRTTMRDGRGGFGMDRGMNAMWH